MSNTKIFKQLTVNNVTLLECPFASELAMEAFLMENPAVLSLNKSLKKKAKENYPRILDCEVTLGTEKKGRLDMLVQYDENKIGVVELKKGVINGSALRQLYGYLREKKEILEYLKQNLNVDADARNETLVKRILTNSDTIKFVGVLVGRSVDSDIKEPFPLSNIPKEYRSSGDIIPVNAITIVRYKSTDCVYVVSQVEANEKDSNGLKDNSRYLFLGESYCKRRLVHAVIKNYVVKENCDLSKLGRAFPSNMRKTHGLYKRPQEIENKNHRRFLYDDPITLSDGTEIVTCGEWTAGKEFDAFLNQAESVGLQITQE